MEDRTGPAERRVHRAQHPPPLQRPRTDRRRRIDIYAFEWSRGIPDQDAFEVLMQEAAREIDAWIAERFLSRLCRFYRTHKTT